MKIAAKRLGDLFISVVNKKSDDDSSLFRFRVRLENIIMYLVGFSECLGLCFQ